MSYILEALKKSERERKQESVPDLQADHSLPFHPRPDRKPLVRWLAGATALLFLGGGGWFWWQRQDEVRQPPASVQHQVPAHTPDVNPPPAQIAMVSAPSLKPTGQPPKIQKKISGEARQAVTEAPQQNQTKTIPAPVQQTIPVTPEPHKEQQLKEVTYKPLPEEQIEPTPSLLEELPPNVRSSIPELSFAGHVYSEDAKKRLIIINNRVVREGDNIGNGLSLREITLDGVIMRYKSLAFQVKLF